MYPELPMLPAVASGTPTLNQIHHCDALSLLRALPAKSVHLAILDTPYGTTEAPWDVAPDLEALWVQLKRVVKSPGAVLAFGSQPFTTDLILSNRAWFRYEWIWEKSRAMGYLNANRIPMKAHENIITFYEREGAYRPQMAEGKAYNHKRGAAGGVYRARPIAEGYTTVNDGSRYPRTVLCFASPGNPIHATQKPVDLLEYLIRSYTAPGDIVLDPFMGSGSTAIAARQVGRKFIGCDADRQMVDKARNRLEQPAMLSLFAALNF